MASNLPTNPIAQASPGDEPASANENHGDDSGNSRPLDETAAPPKDRFGLVYIVAVLLGFTQLVPWNFYYMSSQYFDKYKLNSTVSEGIWYRTYFIQYLANTSMFCRVAFLALDLFSTFHSANDNRPQLKRRNTPSHRFNWRSRLCGCGRDPRIIYSLTAMLIAFIAQVALALPDTSSWPLGFFWFIIVSLAIASFAGGVLSASSFGLFAILPRQYSNGVVLGTNLCGAVAAIVGLISRMTTPTLLWSGFTYLLSASLIIILTLFAFGVLPYLSFFKYYLNRHNAVISATSTNPQTAHEEGDATVAALIKEKPDGETNGTTEPTVKITLPAQKEKRREILCCGLRIPAYHIIIPQIWKHLLAVWCVMFATLALFPGTHMLIVPKQTSPDSFLGKYWLNIAVFLVFNLTATLGNFAAWFDWFVRLPTSRPNVYWILVIVRAVLSFVFFLFMCNYLPSQRTLPILFSHDWLYIVGSLVFGFTNGCFVSLAMMYAPRSVKDPRDAPTAGMLAALFISLGLVTGSLFSFVPRAVVVDLGRAFGLSPVAAIGAPTFYATTTAASFGGVTPVFNVSSTF